MQLSANPWVDAVDHISTLLAVHSLILRSAEILLEIFLARKVLVFSVVPFGKLTLEVCFLALLC